MEARGLGAIIVTLAHNLLSNDSSILFKLTNVIATLLWLYETFGS